MLKGGFTLFTVKNYVLVEDLEEAYVLNQKKNNVIIGGNLWLKMGNKKISHAIDLSGLGLDQIVETEDSFEIGCMVSLRDLETNQALNSYFNGAFAKAAGHIVGVQFRNCATVGGSIFPRFGFSDILTCLLALDTYVELYKGGAIPLSEFVNMQPDQDILVKVIVKKDARRVAYLTHRMTATDFPVLTCAVAKQDSKWQVVLGARPGRAKLIPNDLGVLSEVPTKEEIQSLIRNIVETVDFGSNMRGSKEYRRHLAGVLIKRGITEIAEGEV
jgi:CO/xanthine dehydrogenase FAD-binding subunit